MNEKQTNVAAASDDEILGAVRRRLAGVEPLVPSPQTWRPDESRTERAARTSIRTPARLGGLISLGVIAALLVVIVGAGLGARNGSTGRATPVPGPLTTLVYELAAANGAQPTAADLDTTVQIIRDRLATLGAAQLVVTAQPPNQVSISVSGAVDLVALGALVGQSGHLEFVLLPPETYGSCSPQYVPGATALPAVGDAIDPALPVQFTGDQLDRARSAAADDTAISGQWVVGFAFKDAAAAEFATWTAAHVNDYFAIVLDGKVLEVPYILNSITDGVVEIGGDFTEASAQRLATILKYGQLPFPLQLVSTSVATPPPSADALASSIVAPTVATPSDLPSSGRTLGDPKAPVTLDVWVDFRCTACEEFQVTTMPQPISNYVRPGKLKIAYHDFVVIDGHDGSTASRDAASAALCAADQGKFWAYQDWLLANQSPSEAPGAFSLDRLTELARRADLDMTSFETCLTSGRHNADVLAESKQVPSSAVGVPSFFIDGAAAGVASSGSVSTYADLSAAIDAALAKAAADSPSSTPTAAPTLMIYVVTSADKSLADIAARFGVPLAQLEMANPLIENYNIILPGMTINIPPPDWLPTAAPPSQSGMP
jgi:protein-export membrane protein SecD